MPDILQDLPISAPPNKVWESITAPAGLDAWWTLTSAGEPTIGSEYTLDFGPEYVWRARVTQSERERVFELEMTRSDRDWDGTRVRFLLQPKNGGTWLQFQHVGWPDANEHYRVTCHCWAMYLRVLRRHLEHGEFVPYDQRLAV
ncbi:MAG: SRPBCC domain-containing protein [Gemmatimonadaceae bacterium]